jgi:hypothetical protein
VRLNKKAFGSDLYLFDLFQLTVVKPPKINEVFLALNIVNVFDLPSHLE